MSRTSSRPSSTDRRNNTTLSPKSPPLQSSKTPSPLLTQQIFIHEESNEENNYVAPELINLNDTSQQQQYEHEQEYEQQQEEEEVDLDLQQTQTQRQITPKGGFKVTLTGIDEVERTVMRERQGVGEETTREESKAIEIEKKKRKYSIGDMPSEQDLIRVVYRKLSCQEAEVSPSFPFHPSFTWVSHPLTILPGSKTGGLNLQTERGAYHHYSHISPYTLNKTLIDLPSFDPSYYPPDIEESEKSVYIRGGSRFSKPVIVKISNNKMTVEEVVHKKFPPHPHPPHTTSSFAFLNQILPPPPPPPQPFLPSGFTTRPPIIPSSLTRTPQYTDTIGGGHVKTTSWWNSIFRKPQKMAEPQEVRSRERTGVFSETTESQYTSTPYQPSSSLPMPTAPLPSSLPVPTAPPGPPLSEHYRGDRDTFEGIQGGRIIEDEDYRLEGRTSHLTDNGYGSSFGRRLSAPISLSSNSAPMTMTSNRGITSDIDSRRRATLSTYYPNQNQSLSVRTSDYRVPQATSEYSSDYYHTRTPDNRVQDEAAHNRSTLSSISRTSNIRGAGTGYSSENNTRQPTLATYYPSQTRSHSTAPSTGKNVRFQSPTSESYHTFEPENNFEDRKNLNNGERDLLTTPATTTGPRTSLSSSYDNGTPFITPYSRQRQQSQQGWFAR